MTSKKVSKENGEKPCHLRDIETLSRTELHRKYPKEYNSWKNRKGEAKKEGNWSAEFDDFGDFLRHVGPIPEEGMTLDRTDPQNPRYAPGLVDWLDKRGQANNRTSARQVSVNGVMTPLSEAARARGQEPASVRQRGYRGWAEMDALSGTRNGVSFYFGKDPRTYRPWPQPDASSEKWERAWLRSGGPRPGNSRFDYLIRHLKQDLIQSNERLAEMYETNDEYPDFEQAQLELAQNNSLKHELEQAKELYQQWADVVARYEGHRRDAEALGSLRYRTYRRRDEEE